MAESPKPSRGAGSPVRPAVGAGPSVRRPGWAQKTGQASSSIARSARPGRSAGSAVRATAAKSQAKVEVDDHYLLALAKQGSTDAYDRLVRRYHSFVRLKASSYFLIGGDSEDLIQEGLVGLYKAIRDFRSDRESSFRNFAELCITRQIITAVKTATRNKHTPLNGYVSFSSSPAGAQGEGEPTLDEVLPGSVVWDPVNQVISSEELRSLVTCLSTVLSDLESRVLSLYLDGHSYVDIGIKLGCDCKTVDNALQRVKRKVGTHLRERAVEL
ncbi:MAG: polymerase sporulation-specific sigma factor [Solirubrobacteraceae bacterium]|nr:polymerase sporulation-specific sigma factor [Solirubrobacteraceae bacterium]